MTFVSTSSQRPKFFMKVYSVEKKPTTRWNIVILAGESEAPNTSSMVAGQLVTKVINASMGLSGEFVVHRIKFFRALWILCVFFEMLYGGSKKAFGMHVQ